MVKEGSLPAFQCEKCNLVLLDKKKTQEHEKTPIKGHPGLDGLIVRRVRRDLRRNEEVYTVFRENEEINHEHERLYVHRDHYVRSLRVANPRVFKPTCKADVKVEAIFNQFKEMFGSCYEGEPAGQIIGYMLYTRSEDSFDSDVYNDFSRMSEQEFERVTGRLKNMYPEFYGNVRFKSKVPPASTRYRPKKLSKK